MPLDMIRDTACALPLLADPIERQEVEHRIANSLQLITGLLSIQARESTDTAVREALAAAVGRISAVASVHRQLCQSEAGNLVHIGAYLPQLASALEQSCSGIARRRIRLDVEPATVPAQFASLIGVVVSELVMNACKHAFDPAEEGVVSVRLSFPSPSRFRLEVRDSGGRAAEGPPGATAGLGMRIIDAMSRRLGGSYAYAPDEHGMRFAMRGSVLL